jgi:hypothetical protein
MEISNNNIKNETLTTDIINKKTTIIKEMLYNQLPNITLTKKLSYNDISRISRYINSSIFDASKCAVWNGYVTNEKKQHKGIFINFYFNHKKTALHRLLYLNYIGEILNTEYIKFSCENKGKCCNIHHIKKYSYSPTSQLVINAPPQPIININNTVHINQNKNDLTIEL